MATCVYVTMVTLVVYVTMVTLVVCCHGYMLLCHHGYTCCVLSWLHAVMSPWLHLLCVVYGYMLLCHHGYTCCVLSWLHAVMSPWLHLLCVVMATCFYVTMVTHVVCCYACRKRQKKGGEQSILEWDVIQNMASKIGIVGEKSVRKQLYCRLLFDCH
jgi:hypothetical protein